MLHRKLPIFVTLILLFTGCATNGPVPGTPDFDKAVQASGAVLSGDVLVSRRGAWYPDRYGYKHMRIVGRNEAWGVWGAFILTSEEVLFLPWDETSLTYVEGVRIDRSEISGAVVDTFGAGKRIVILTGGDFQTFEVVKEKSSTIIDAELTESIRAELNAGSD